MVVRNSRYVLIAVVYAGLEAGTALLVDAGRGVWFVRAVIIQVAGDEKSSGLIAAGSSLSAAVVSAFVGGA